MSAGPYTPPPGLVGEIAQFIYAAAPRPVPEIALAGAIGLMAGISGKAFNVSGTGLNLYVMLLAQTGTGKEAMATGSAALMKSLRTEVPASEQFTGPASIASGPALLKHLANSSSCFVSILGEFGLTLQQLANPRAPAHLVELRKVILDVYGKSGRNSELRPSIYSDKEKSTATVQSPAVSLLGESTPESFYRGLTEGLVADGLLPRFTVIEYRGERVPLQEMRSEAPSPKLKERLAGLCVHALSLMQKREVIDVGYSDAARADFDDFEKACTTKVNEANRAGNIVAANLWTRAHMKALKLAALVAVGVNPYHPTITVNEALWAIQIEKETVRNLLSRFESGEVGDAASEEARVQRVIEAFAAYYTKPWHELKSYDVRGDLHEKRIVTYTYLHRRCCNTKYFQKQHNQEPTKLLKDAIRILIERGDVEQMHAAQMQREYETTSAGYMFKNMSTLERAMSRISQ